jgi:hypothetical protein
LGRQKRQIPPHLQLQRNEASQPQQTNEIRLANQFPGTPISALAVLPANRRNSSEAPTQKPLALLERILLSSTNEGDVVLDPFAGASTTLISALRLRRQAVGCELSIDFVNLSLRRICSNLVQVNLSVLTLHIPLDPQPVSEDRSCSGGFVLTSSNAAQYPQLSFRAQRGALFHRTP